MSPKDRCDRCSKVIHSTEAKAKEVARRTHKNNLNDGRVFNAYQCDQPGCKAYIVGTHDKFQTQVSRKLRRKPNARHSSE